MQLLDYSEMTPAAISGPGSYVIGYGREPDRVFTAVVFTLDDNCLDVGFKFGVVPGPMLDDLFVAATAVMYQVARLNTRRPRGR